MMPTTSARMWMMSVRTRIWRIIRIIIWIIIWIIERIPPPIVIPAAIRIIIRIAKTNSSIYAVRVS